MTCEPGADRFNGAFPFATLVLVDMKKKVLSAAQGLGHPDVAGILTNCRAALAYARRIGLPLAFVRSGGGNCDEAGDWINGFEPQRSEALFDRRSSSCYSSPYFKEGMRESGGVVVIAGSWVVAGVSQREEPRRGRQSRDLLVRCDTRRCIGECARIFGAPVFARVHRLRC